MDLNSNILTFFPSLHSQESIMFFLECKLKEHTVLASSYIGSYNITGAKFKKYCIWRLMATQPTFMDSRRRNWMMSLLPVIPWARSGSPPSVLIFLHLTSGVWHILSLLSWNPFWILASWTSDSSSSVPIPLATPWSPLLPPLLPDTYTLECPRAQSLFAPLLLESLSHICFLFYYRVIPF